MSAKFLNSEVAKNPESVRLMGAPNESRISALAFSVRTSVLGRIRRFFARIIPPPRAFFYRHEAEAHRTYINSAKLKQRSPDVFRF